MDKRTVLAVAISIIILLAYQFFFAPAPMPVAQDNSATLSKEKDNVASKSEVKTISNITTKSKSIEVEKVSNGFVEIYFDKHSGNINKVSVVKYRDKKLPIVTFKNDNDNYMKVLDGYGDNYSMEIKEIDGKKIVIFSALQNNIGITKTYTIGKEGYLIDLNLKVSNNSDQTIKLDGSIDIGPGFGEGFEKSSYIFEGPIIYNGEKREEVAPGKVKDTVKLDAPKWIGYTTKYYLFAAIDGNLELGKIEKMGESAIVKGVKQIILNPKSTSDTKFNIYVGPKEYDLLKSFNLGLENSIDFGWFKFLAVPMLKFMLFIYSFTKNYGVAIIILTIIVKLLTYPLTIKSMTSMKKMQQIQPKLMEIKEKFKNDPQKMNTAMMELYRKHGVNPMGGCLPMIIQIPIFFALYKALLVSVELKGSPFIFWITDLSDKDPYYITPIIMGITMFIQQKMTPSTMDPMQQKIFLMMPVIFTFLFLNFPSGLVIYWLTNNILSIIQQYYINKKLT
ncbi:membrane protein insertase YidC [Calditerrivibrio sp.]|uniref:membrane protein insertase YidC n=1 Tax=Calditerrivibrio sp. TaxID=2792612 RepID=UPI003D136C91